jgi:hypothetical protein
MTCFGILAAAGDPRGCEATRNSDEYSRSKGTDQLKDDLLPEGECGEHFHALRMP